MTVNKLSALGVLRFGPQLAGFIERPLLVAEGELRVEHVLEACALDKMQMWVVAEPPAVLAVATTEVVDYPALRSLKIVTLGGDGSECWGHLLYWTLVRFACKWGCVRLEACGRPGLVRGLAPFGFRQSYVGLVRDLTTG